MNDVAGIVYRLHHRIKNKNINDFYEHNLSSVENDNIYIGTLIKNRPQYYNYRHNDFKTEIYGDDQNLFSITKWVGLLPKNY